MQCRLRLILKVIRYLNICNIFHKLNINQLCDSSPERNCEVKSKDVNSRSTSQSFIYK